MKHRKISRYFSALKTPLLVSFRAVIPIQRICGFPMWNPCHFDHPFDHPEVGGQSTSSYCEWGRPWRWRWRWWRMTRPIQWSMGQKFSSRLFFQREKRIPFISILYIYWKPNRLDISANDFVRKAIFFGVTLKIIKDDPIWVDCLNIISITQMLHGAGIFTYIYPKNGPVM